ncbi:hypothetical protein [Motilimonas sp. E26]|uniref:hypothetical protein n=1 Tax=Motilimonas TaxID=1914248 RepID=UPI001E367535|nr:hypothetical protein [Motilimonas sp. E26]MCE0556521.1 hypothetical protein [Motilimonas sp. E26]
MKPYFAAALLSAFHLPATAVEIQGSISLQQRSFVESAQFSHQGDNQTSIAIEPELYLPWNDGQDAFIFTPFARLDSLDDERSHWDIQEAKWVHLRDDWEFELGLGIVFWGVTESQHLVDVINQTDQVETVNGDRKLGQPMAHLSLIRDWGVVNAFILPGFRERTFAGEKGRLRTPLVVNPDQAQYESSAKAKHIDFALRWSRTFGDWDVGVAGFKGTDREPILQPYNQNELVPYYQQMWQISTDIQATLGEWLWKIEALHKEGQFEHYQAGVAGFEYTLIGLADTNIDLGLLSEYNWDQRGLNASTPYQNDLFLGTRLVFNDVDGSEILLGVARDLEQMSYSGRIEGSTRFGQHWRLNLEAWLFYSSESNDPLYSLKDDDMLSINLEYFF